MGAPQPSFNTNTKRKPKPIPIHDERPITRGTPKVVAKQVKVLGSDPVVQRLQGQVKQLPGVTSQFAKAGNIGNSNVNRFNKTYASPFIKKKLDEYRGEKKRMKIISSNSLVNEYANLST